MAFEKFTDTIFLKRDSNLQKQLEALEKLRVEYPDNKRIDEELKNVKKGLDGEKEIEYQLSNANIGMYVLHDVNFEYKDLKAQIDYIIVTKAFCYFIECKNWAGNIIVNEKGDFIREQIYNGNAKEEGQESPLTQVENQREKYKKLCNSEWKDNLVDKFNRRIFEKNFKYFHRVMVVFTNKKTILKLNDSPEEIKDKVIRADALVRTIEQDIAKSKRTLWDNQEETWKWANQFLKESAKTTYNYYQIFKEKFVSQEKIEVIPEVLRKRLKEFREARSKEKAIPPYYVFNNDELEKLIELKPKTKEELEKANILPRIKVLAHGELIVKIINNDE